MGKILFLLLFTCIAYGQVQLKGQVVNEIDKEGIHVFNKTKGKYTITDEKGNFQIEVSLHDSLSFSGLLFQLKQIQVTPQILEKNVLSIFLLAKINKLEAVYLGYQLTGDLQIDSKEIKTKKLLKFGVSGLTAGTIGFWKMTLPVDGQSPVTNTALGTSFEGINIIPLLKLLLPKRNKKSAPKHYTKMNLKQFFGANLFSNALYLKPEDQGLFMQFIENDSLVNKSMQINNKMMLLERLLWLRKQFKPAKNE